MTNAHSVLIVGPSSVPYSESGEDGRLANLLLGELRQLQPRIDWTTAGVQIFQGTEMRERVADAVAQHGPDLVILRAASYHLTHEYVLWKVRDRWPALYPAAKFIDARLKQLAGGPRDRANTPRPWVYAVPRWLAAKTIGTSIGRSPEECARNITDTLDYLLAREELFLYLWPSTSATFPKKRDNPQHERNVELLWRDVLDYANRRHIPRFNSADIRAAMGIEKSKSVDGIHASLGYRTYQARYLATKILEALELRPAEFSPARV